MTCGRAAKVLIFLVSLCSFSVFAGGMSPAVPSPRPHTRESSPLLVCIDTCFSWHEGGRFARPAGAVPDVVAIHESPDGRLVAWGDEESNVFLYDLRTKRALVVNDRTFSRPPRSPAETICYKIEAVCFGNDETLYWLDGRGTAWRADLQAGRVVARRRINAKPALGSSSGAILSGSFVVDAPSGSPNILLEFLRPHVYVLRAYDLGTGELRKTCEIYPRKPGQYHWVNTMAPSPDGALLAIASDHNAGIVSMRPFRLVRTLAVEYVNAMAFSPDASRLAVADRSPRVSIYDVATGKQVRSLALSDEWGSVDAVSASSSRMVWLHQGPYLHRLDVETGELERVLRVPRVTALFASKQHSRLYAGLWDGRLQVYRLTAEKGSGSGDTVLNSRDSGGFP